MTWKCVEHTRLNVSEVWSVCPGSAHGAGAEVGVPLGLQGPGGPFHFSCINKGPAFLSEAPLGLSSPTATPSWSREFH